MSAKYFSVSIFGGNAQRYAPAQELPEATDDQSAKEIAKKEFEACRFNDFYSGYLIVKLVEEVTKQS